MRCAMQSVVVISLLWASAVFAAPDANCLKACLSRGNSLQSCQSQCQSDSNNSNMPLDPDYHCVNNCVANGELYEECQMQCSQID